ncbi:TPA: hypothetical protein DEO28_04230 [Candidatus Dependentiae bacterium]|nr:MAG: hypothetical protein UR14_C0006G0082 [candidate division TM6 bacterium GW2011_GWE2_31_21]KKP53495.1 MAG: hypothetical protein UR43_C0004G0036 [candidate division TM6 bacterium GW2011_GWF2_33_332]HBS48264.1 hypothetical protein [Candidatus Dependentiae bacterium]HBZ73691.1 hypothetical protein [Candidatus Dependentiae bacterium]
MGIVGNSFFAGLIVGLVFGFLFVFEKRKLINFSAEKFSYSFTQALSSSFGVFFRYLLLLVVFYLLISKYNFSLIYLFIGYLISFWTMLLFTIFKNKSFKP